MAQPARSHQPDQPFQRREQLRIERERRGWTQQQVADNLETTVVNVSRWERGITTPHLHYRWKLCKLYQKNEIELGLVESSAFAKIIDTSIPQLDSRLVGRKETLDRLKELLLEPETRQVALYGLPGSGKTALARTIAQDLSIHERFDALLWAEMGFRPNLLSILKRWSKLLNISDQHATIAEWTQALRAAVGSRRLLIIFDDIWRPEDIWVLTAVGHTTTSLVTTRSPRLAYHLAVSAIHVEPWSLDQAEEFMHHFAPIICEREPALVRQLIEITGGLPLALRLLAAYVRSRAYGADSRRIRAALHDLFEPTVRFKISEPWIELGLHPSLSADEHVSLTSMIAVSEQALGPQEREAFRALSIFAPTPLGFSGEAALAVADAKEPLLDALADAGMIQQQGEGRYTMHPVLADYARLGADLTSAYDRLIAFAVWYIQQNDHDMLALEREESTLLTALEAAFRIARHIEYIQMVSKLQPFLLRIDQKQAQEHLTRAREIARVVHGSFLHLSGPSHDSSEELHTEGTHDVEEKNDE